LLIELYLELTTCILLSCNTYTHNKFVRLESSDGKVPVKLFKLKILQTDEYFQKFISNTYKSRKCIKLE